MKAVALDAGTSKGFFSEPIVAPNRAKGKGCIPASEELARQEAFVDAPSPL